MVVSSSAPTSLCFLGIVLCSLPIAVTAQELPAYRLPAFSTNTSLRQNVCSRQEAFHNRSVALRNALVGFELRPWFPFGDFSTLDPNTGAISAEQPGFSVEIMDEIANRAKFRWRNSFGVGNLATELGNRTLDELLQWTIRTYDVSAAQFSKTVPRINSGASFPEGIYDGSIIMVGLVQGTESSLNVWSFLAPFNAGVWIMILVTFLVSGLVYWWMEWYNEDSDRQELGHKPTENVFYAALSFIGDINFEPSTDYARLFVFALSFWSLLTASAYTANLASFLVAENTPSLQIESVSDAVRQNLPMCVLVGSAADTLVSNAHPGAVLIRKDVVGGEEPVYWGVLDGECAVALVSVTSWDEFRRNSQVNVNCQLAWVGRVFRFIQGGFVTFSDSGTLCTSLIRDVLNLHIVEMEEDGFVQEAWQRHLESSGDINCEAGQARSVNDDGTDDSNHRLSLQDMGGLFIVFYGMTAIAIVMAIFSKRNGKRTPFLCNKSNTNNDGEGDTMSSVEKPQQGNQATTAAYSTQPQQDGILVGSTDEHIAQIRQEMGDMNQQMSDLHQQIGDMMELMKLSQPALRM